MNKVEVPDHPFRRIALCLSGGGYRAAAFHLGAMAYLYHLRFQGRPLLENVKALSTVSGGTITGVVYALKSRQGHSFPEIYTFLKDRLLSLDLVREGLNKLNVDAIWDNPAKRKNLINAFAEIYDREFTGGETFDIFEHMQGTHLEEVMFNATEFSRGLIFRFQNDGRFGNYYYPVRKTIGGEVKLSDIIAASSCFTGGFEPIEWPGDFIHEEALELKEEAPLMPVLGLMDGGIYDNQGVDSILRSEERVGAEPYDLILVSDVTSPYMKPFRFFQSRTLSGWRAWTPGQVKSKLKKYGQWINAILIFALLFSTAILILNFGNNLITGILMVVAVLSIVLNIAFSILRKKIRRGINEGLKYVRKELSDDLPLDNLSSLKFSKIPFHHLEILLLDRINALVTLTGEVFLKTVRRLVYGRLYDADRYQYRRAGNLIRELTREDFEEKRKRKDDDLQYFQNIPGCPPWLKGDYEAVVGEKLERVAETAAGFGTNLWFTETDKMDKVLENLIVCGEATMCFTLIKYLLDLRQQPENGFDRLPLETREAIEDLWQQCTADWHVFKIDPEFIFREDW